MSELYRRRWELLVDDQLLVEQTDERQFRITFDISIDFGGANSYADIALYNLSYDTSSRVKKGSVLTLRAGYPDTIDTIFVGEIQNIFRERQGASVVARYICRATTRKTVINQTFGAGARITDLIKACTESMGYPALVEESQFADVPVYAGGYTLSGDPRTYLDTLARAHGFDYAIENSRIVVVRKGFARRAPIFDVSQFTGMEGIPEISEVGANVTMRLSPKLRIGGQVNIESTLKTFNFSSVYFVDVPETAGTGLYKILRITHTGDSYGDSWSSRVEGVATL